MPMSEVIILAGGLGTRLKSIIGNQQKCVSEYSGQPFIFHLFSYLYHQRLTKLVLALSHDAARVKQVVDGSLWANKLEIHYSIEETPLGTAGAVKQAAGFVEANDFMVMNGDTYTELDYQAMMAAHKKKSADLTIAVTSQNANHDSGYIDFDTSCRIKTFREKVPQGQIYSSMGVYAMNRSFLDAIPSDQVCSLELDMFPHALDCCMYAFPSELPFWDIGTEERYRKQVNWSIY